jgi:hypothetical protein
MECVEDEIFRSKCSGVNTTGKALGDLDSFFERDILLSVVILGPLKGGLNKRVTEIVM